MYIINLDPSDIRNTCRCLMTISYLVEWIPSHFYIHQSNHRESSISNCEKSFLFIIMTKRYNIVKIHNVVDASMHRLWMSLYYIVVNVS